MLSLSEVEEGGLYQIRGKRITSKTRVNGIRVKSFDEGRQELKDIHNSGIIDAITRI